MRWGLSACKELMDASESTSISSRPMRVQMLLGKWMDALKNCWYQAILKSESDLIVTCCVVRNGTYFHWGSNGLRIPDTPTKVYKSYPPINLSGRWLKSCSKMISRPTPHQLHGHTAYVDEKAQMHREDCIVKTASWIVSTSNFSQHTNVCLPRTTSMCSCWIF